MAAARCSDCTPSSTTTTTDGPEKEKTYDTTEEEAKRYDDKCRLFNAYKVDKPSIIQKQTDELSTMIQNSLTEREMIEMTCGPRPMKVKANNNNNTTLSSSSLQFSVFHHPLRWDKMTNTSRRTVHHHPLQLVHSSLIYGSYGGDWSIPHSNPSLINYGPPSNTIPHEYMQALMSYIVKRQKNTIE